MRNKTLISFFLLGLISLFELSACLPKDIFTHCENNYPKLDSVKEKILLIIAHQDDDAFIVTRIKDHLDKGDQVMVDWVAKSYQGGEDYGNMRIKEAKRAMNMLGIDSLHYNFLNFPDSKTYKFIPQIIRKLKVIIQNYQPNVIYVEAYEMGNIDHDVSHFSTVQSVKELNYKCLIYEFPQYSAYDIPNFLPFELRKYPDSITTFCRKLTIHERNFVMAYWKIYKSQDFPFLYYMFLLGQEDLIFKYEYLRPLLNYDYTKKPFGASEAYKRYIQGLKFVDFQRGVKSYLNLK